MAMKNGLKLVCICFRPEFGEMYQCPTCHTWYHNVCMKVSDDLLNELEDTGGVPPCPKCETAKKSQPPPATTAASKKRRLQAGSDSRQSKKTKASDPTQDKQHMVIHAPPTYPPPQSLLTPPGNTRSISGAKTRLCQSPLKNDTFLPAYTGEFFANDTRDSPVEPQKTYLSSFLTNSPETPFHDLAPKPLPTSNPFPETPTSPYPNLNSQPMTMRLLGTTPEQTKMPTSPPRKKTKSSNTLLAGRPKMNGKLTSAPTTRVSSTVLASNGAEITNKPPKKRTKRLFKAKVTTTRAKEISNPDPSHNALHKDGLSFDMSLPNSKRKPPSPPPLPIDVVKLRKMVKKLERDSEQLKDVRHDNVTLRTEFLGLRTELDDAKQKVEKLVSNITQELLSFKNDGVLSDEQFRASLCRCLASSGPG